MKTVGALIAILAICFLATSSVVALEFSSSLDPDDVGENYYEWNFTSPYSTMEACTKINTEEFTNDENQVYVEIQLEANGSPLAVHFVNQEATNSVYDRGVVTGWDTSTACNNFTSHHMNAVNIEGHAYCVTLVTR